ncbi:MAG: hypothetical protein ACM3KD_11295 [Hyphomicrobiaceae bacterium]
METEASFQQWALIELFGHQKIAGLVTEQAIGGCAFIRVDVPAIDGQQPFTKLYGQGAIYAMTFVTEPVARAAAQAYRIPAVNPYDIPELRQQRIPWDHGRETGEEDEEGF